jgi:predicted ATP-dependent protease
MSELFKVQADFSEVLDRSGNQAIYAGLINRIAEREALRPITRPGLARMLDESARLAEDSERLSLRVGMVADILREADHWAGEAGAQAIDESHIARAVAERRHRADRIRERSLEAITRDIILIDTDGGQVGAVNGLAVTLFGNIAFGRPSRITARARMGTGRVIDIEREVELGGPLHSKGVLILSGYLAARYALSMPVSLSATLVFEQSYGGVDGDSASSTELYALLSALSDVPIDQSFAVTGSVNQRGEVQAIGGVNEKVEGFFDVCRARGLTGRQGVLIPAANVQHLMLRDDVVAACRDGQFAVYAVSTIDQGIEILTGVAAGERGSDGGFPAGTVNRLVEAKLTAFAQARRRFNADDDHDSGERDDGGR